MAAKKKSEAQEKRLAKLREEQDDGLKVVKVLDGGGMLLFRYVKKWQRDGWARGVNTDTIAYTYAMDSEGKVYGYCANEPPAAVADLVTYPEKRRARVHTRKPGAAKGTAKRAVPNTKASTKRKRVIAENVALPGAA